MLEALRHRLSAYPMLDDHQHENRREDRCILESPGSPAGIRPSNSTRGQGVECGI